jgi:hypothetical protein
VRVVDDPVGALLDRLNLGSETADPKSFGGTVEIVASGKVQRIEATVMLVLPFIRDAMRPC